MNAVRINDLVRDSLTKEIGLVLKIDGPKDTDVPKSYLEKKVLTVLSETGTIEIDWFESDVTIVNKWNKNNV